MNKILIIDDELDICLLLSKYLKSLDFETEYATNLIQARLNINLFLYNVIFIDLNLLEGSGYEIINYARENKLNTKIIVISAHDSEISKSMESGAHFFLVKPFSLKMIDNALKALNVLPT